MWNIPTQKRLDKIPRLYETENVPLQEKMIHLHFFIEGSDWYVCEYDGKDHFFGFAILNNDYRSAEWGYMSFSELKAIKFHGWLEIDCELKEHWTPKRAIEIEKIRMSQDWLPENENPKNSSVTNKFACKKTVNFKKNAGSIIRGPRFKN